MPTSTSLASITRIPDVVGAVLSDAAGSVIEFSGRVDGETAGAVQSFCVDAFAKAGQLLGLGTVQRTTFATSAGACVITAPAGRVLGVYVDANKPTAPVEKRLAEILQRA